MELSVSDWTYLLCACTAAFEARNRLSSRRLVHNSKQRAYKKMFLIDQFFYHIVHASEACSVERTILVSSTNETSMKRGLQTGKVGISNFNAWPEWYLHIWSIPFLFSNLLFIFFLKSKSNKKISWKWGSRYDFKWLTRNQHNSEAVSWLLLCLLLGRNHRSKIAFSDKLHFSLCSTLFSKLQIEIEKLNLYLLKQCLTSHAWNAVWHLGIFPSQAPAASISFFFELIRQKAEFTASEIHNWFFIQSHSDKLVPKNIVLRTLTIRKNLNKSYRNIHSHPICW